MVRRFPAGRYFNPRSPDGERPTGSRHHTWGMAFQSTLPGWGATVQRRDELVAARFQSTLPGWGATISQTHHVCCGDISIHAPRMGSDQLQRTNRIIPSDFNPRSPDGERPQPGHESAGSRPISIHAPRMGSDPVGFPGWRRGMGISIHAPRMGSDFRASDLSRYEANFNPRSPDGERPAALRALGAHVLFQSTLPGWGATIIPCGFSYHGAISIHAPRMGSDSCSLFPPPRESYFNPRSPDGERLERSGLPCEFIQFQSTLPGWGATCQRCAISRRAANFNPRSPDGERPRKWTSSPTIWAKSSIFNTDCIADRR